MNGIIVVNKEPGFTSMDCCAIIRRISGERRVGHTGTLDPNASGVLPVCIGKATRIIEYMDLGSKSYTAGFRLGYISDTEDIWGDVRASEGAAKVTEQELRAALASFSGAIEQMPPMYSAKKINGQRLYELARQGKEVERKTNKIFIYSIELKSFDGTDGVFDIKCSRGTYVRSICSELGKKLGCGAVMSSLVRKECCGFRIEDAHTLSELKEELKLLPMGAAFTGAESIELGERAEALFLNGNPLWKEELSEAESEAVRQSGSEGFIAVYGSGRLLGTLRRGKIDKVLAE